MERNPFVSTRRRRLTGDEPPRSRRLEAGEGERLLQTAGPHLRALVEAALETGCRKGELLSLQWSQVRLDGRPELSLPAQKTKTGKPRTVPISARLLSILAMRRTAPDGEPASGHGVRVRDRDRAACDHGHDGVAARLQASADRRLALP